MASPAPESKPTTAIPEPEPTDSSKVASCLETAQELWTNGQMREAVRWIQRGADAAEEDGNDMRALALARLGAELTAQMKGSGSPAPKAPSPPRPGADKAEKTDKAETSDKSDKSEDAPSPASHSPSPPRVRVSNPPPLPGAASPSTPATSTASSVAPNAPSQAPKPPSPSVSAPAESAGVATASNAEANSSSSSGPESSARPATKAPAAERSSIKPSASRTPGPLSSAPAKSSAAPAAPAAVVEDIPSAKGKTSTPLAELISSGLAQRVSVKRSALDASLLVVRPAAGNGAKVITGARQAVLIYLDGDGDS